MKKANPTDKFVGARARMRRLMLHMTQTELGTALGVTFQQVQKYENGTNRISASRLQRLSEILHAPVSFFFEGAPQDRGMTDLSHADWDMSDISHFLATADGQNLVRAFVRIQEPRLRRAIVALVQQINPERTIDTEVY
jgi:transcriptional regulator with XRE-family HTH domain